MTNPAEPAQWMTVEEVARHLRLSRSKVYAMAQKGEMPCSKIAGRWRFYRPEVDAWLLRQRPEAQRAGTERGSDG